MDGRPGPRRRWDRGPVRPDRAADGRRWDWEPMREDRAGTVPVTLDPQATRNRTVRLEHRRRVRDGSQARLPEPRAPAPEGRVARRLQAGRGEHVQQLAVARPDARGRTPAGAPGDQLLHDSLDAAPEAPAHDRFTDATEFLIRRPHMPGAEANGMAAAVPAGSAAFVGSGHGRFSPFVRSTISDIPRGEGLDRPMAEERCPVQSDASRNTGHECLVSGQSLPSNKRRACDHGWQLR